MSEKLKEKLLFLGVLTTLILVSGGKEIYDIKHTLEFYKEDQSKDDLLKLLSEKIDTNEFYLKDYSTSTSGSNSESFETAYFKKVMNFLDYYYPYMSDEQIATLLNFVEYQIPNYDYSKVGIDDVWNDLLESLIPSAPGYGLSRSMFWLSENYNSTSSKERYSGAGHEFLVFCNIVGYDQLVSAIFQNDVQQIVDVICKETFISQEEAQRFVQLFDNYAAFFGTEKGPELLPDYLDEMRIMIPSMVDSKCKFDSQFRNSLLASILKNSTYFKENGLAFEMDPTEDKFSFQLNFDDYGETSVTLPSYYLDVSMDSSMLIDSAACHIVQNGYESPYPSSSMSLLSHIIGWNHVEYLANSECSVNQKKRMIYQSLDRYFSSEDEFNRFLVALDHNNDVAIHQFFSIWKSQMMDGPLNFRKLLEYNSLRENIIASCHMHYSDYSEEALFTEKGSDLSEVYTIDDFYFYPSKYDYMADFDEVMDYFHSPNSTYTELISKNGYNRRIWETGDRSLDAENTFVLSQELPVQRKDLGNGHFIYYYVKPELFEEGEFVYAFTNVLNQRVSVPISGISTMIENDKTQEMEAIIIVSMDEEPPSKEAYCKVDYFSLCPKDKVYYYNR